MASMLAFTPTAVKRWSCQDTQLPPVDTIKEIHIYDFDNTREPLLVCLDALSRLPN